MRIYTKEENLFLDVRCRGFLLFLEQIQIIDLEVREKIIDCVITLNVTEFNLEDLKLVVLMILLNIPGRENSYQQMKYLVFQKEILHLH